MLRTLFIAIIALTIGFVIGVFTYRAGIISQVWDQLTAGVTEPVVVDPAADAPEAGRWRAFQRADGAAIPDEAQAQLEALGYAGASMAAPDADGVVTHDTASAHAGLNLYSSGHAPEAYLMDMAGEVLHTWRADINDIWPERTDNPKNPYDDYWGRVQLMPNGDLIALFEKIGIFRLDKDSKVVWANDCVAHHDFAVLPDGRIYVLTKNARVIERVDSEGYTHEEFVAILSPQGELLEEISILEMIENSPYAPSIYFHDNGDIFHTNTLDVLPADAPFAPGQVLLCLRNMDMIGTVDLEARAFTWTLSNMWRRPHQPSLLDSGRMLIYDNRGVAGQSRVIEFDPTSQQIHWSYGEEPGEELFSWTHGAAVRLPNGNTLITESDNGRALEVTSDKTIVWEYVNPHRGGDNGELIATIPEMVRLPEDVARDWLR